MIDDAAHRGSVALARIIAWRRHADERQIRLQNIAEFRARQFGINRHHIMSDPFKSILQCAADHADADDADFHACTLNGTTLLTGSASRALIVSNKTSTLMSLIHDAPLLSLFGTHCHGSSIKR